MSSASQTMPGVRAQQQPFWKTVLLMPIIGPLLVLLIFGVIFTVTTEPFLTPRNLSLILQQSVILGALAIGQTLIILGRSLAEGFDPALAIPLALLVTTCPGPVA